METDKKNNPFSRRTFFGVGLVLPFLSAVIPRNAVAADNKEQDDEFVTMLTADGKAVRVRKDALKNAKVIEKKMSNQSLLSWLKPKGLRSK